MRGISQASYDAVAEGFEPVLRTAGADAATLGEQLFSVVDALDGSGSLRRALSDPSRPGDAKADLVAALLGGKVDERVLAALQGLVRGRWSAEADLTEAVERLAAEATFASAQAGGALEQVEDELFRLDRTLVGERPLRQALTDRRAAPQARATLVRDLLGTKVHPATLQLVERAARTPRGRTMAAALGQLGSIAAHRRQQLVAEVTAAVPLTSAQQARLVDLLEQYYGRQVTIQVAVVPQVVGGIRVQVGSEVVDSTVLARLDDVRRRLAG